MSRAESREPIAESRKQKADLKKGYRVLGVGGRKSRTEGGEQKAKRMAPGA